MTLVEFLRARIAEDEAAVEPHRDYMDGVELGAIESGEGFANCSISAPRVLAECEAKRRIIEQCSNRLADEGGKGYDWEPTDWAWHGAMQDEALETLKILALPYVDHPDYRQEWKPGSSFCRRWPRSPPGCVRRRCGSGCNAATSRRP